MKALTLHRPWDQAILHGGKDFENRSWKLWDSMIGKTIALHAGKTYNMKAAEWIEELGLYVPPPKDKSPEGIVGLIKIDRVVECKKVPNPSPWLFGPFGWHISDARPLEKPIPCKGKQGLWTVPDEIREQIKQLIASLAEGEELR